MTADPRRLEAIRGDLSAQEILDSDVVRTRGLAAQAFIWGMPAFLGFRWASEVKQGRLAGDPDAEPFGDWILMRDLSTPEVENTMPNVDTLYGAAYLMLDRHGPVVLEAPGLPDRYWSVEVVDAWFSVVAMVGGREHAEDACVLIVPPGWDGAVPAGITRVIEAPTPRVGIYQRIFVRGPEDVPAVRAMQDRIRLRPLERWPDGPAGFPPIATPEFDALTPLRDLADPLEFFRIVSGYSAINPPWPGHDSLVAMFRSVGLGPGTELPDDPRLREAIVLGARDGQRMIDAANSAQVLRDGWVPPVLTDGFPTPDPLGMAMCQLLHIGVNPASEAIYYTGVRDGDGDLLDGSRDYELRFAAGNFPAIDEGAFWSVTMYDAERILLVRNPIDRHVIRPSDPGLVWGDDGSLAIRLAHRRPDDAPEGNWLPAPAGRFVVTLRAYLPLPDALSGEWFPPAIARPDG